MSDHHHHHGGDHGHHRDHHDHDDHRHPLPPSTEGSVVLEVGGDIGALVVYTPDALAGTEIEIAHRGEDHQFVHTEVRERRLPDTTIFAGVFVAVPAGDYTLLPVAAFPAVDFSVEGGCVVELHWSEAVAETSAVC
jgi:hypothetical protein